MFILVLGLLAGSGGLSAASDWQPREGRELIGTRAPEWRGVEWLQGGPMTLAELTVAGKTVLVRFWLVDCPYCERSAPALRELDERYRERGLVVVGIHHPKSERARDRAVIAETAKRLGFEFPIAHDDQWKTVRDYGIGTVLRSFTSVSFLIDRRGLIRFVHDGGELHAGGGASHAECNAAYASLVAAIEQALQSDS